MFYLGIDVAKASHQCVILDNNGEAICKSFTILSSKSDFSKILSKLKSLNITLSNITCGLEATGNLWENLYSFLNEKSLKVILLNPFQTHKYHQVLMKKAKTDAIDAYVIAGLIRSGHASHSHIPDESVQALRDLVRLKLSYSANIKIFKRKAFSLLNLVFPEFLTLVKDPFNIVCSHILSTYQTALDFKTLKPKHLLKIARSHQGNNYDETWAKNIIASANDSIYSGRASTARGFALKSIITQISNIKDQIILLDSAINDILQPKDDSDNTPADNLLSIPGVGPNTTACVIAEIGDIKRFSSCKEFIGFVGLFPNIQQSGTSLNKATLSTKGSRILKHALYLASVACLKHNPYFKQLYDKKRSQGKAPKQALIVVSHKLASIIYSMLKNNCVYDPQLIAGLA